MTTSSANNSVFRGFFEKQKLTGPNFIDWYRQLRIVLSIDDKLTLTSTSSALIKRGFAGLMLMTMEPEIQQNLENLHANDMLKELKACLPCKAEQNDTVSSCSTSKVQEKTQLSKERCMKSLRAIQSQFKFLTDTLQDFGTMPIFKRTFAQDLDLLEQHLTKEIISQTDCKTILTKLRTTFENAFNSEFKERMQKYTRFDAQSFKDTMICNMDSIGKYMLEIILHH
ncbi:hypothetical protein Tco_1493076 [Tanacetum coccineum]